jgi:inosose dehydratase
MTDEHAYPTGSTLRACPVGIVPLGWPDPRTDLDAFLAQVADLGFSGIQYGEPGPEPDAVRARFEAHGVSLAERYLPIRCTVDGPVSGALTEARAHQDQVVALGGRMLVAAIDGSPERDVHAGRADAAPELTVEGWQRLIELLDDLSQRGQDLGVDTTFHPHAGTFVETPAETARLMEHTEPDRLGLCLDTGHWTVGGGDPLAAVRTYGTRLRHLHLKDVDAAVLAGLQAGGVPSFTAAVEQVVFNPLGEGVLDLDGLLAALHELGYRGWLMVEQDSFVGGHREAAAANRAALDVALDRVPARDR